VLKFTKIGQCLTELIKKLQECSFSQNMVYILWCTASASKTHNFQKVCPGLRPWCQLE